MIPTDSSGGLRIAMMMETARRQAMEVPGDPVHDLHGVQPPPRAAIPDEALCPWPARPPKALCAAQPARWTELRAARDPQPETFEGRTGMASYHRAVGWQVEDALREAEADCWWYSPDLPLELILHGFPEWDKWGNRMDGAAETAEEFADLVRGYEQRMAAGAVFPPLLALAIEPEHDRPAVGLGRWLAMISYAPFTNKAHYSIYNGRHRASAAYRAGQRTFPAFVVGPVRDKIAAQDEFGEDWFLPTMEIAYEKGRSGILDLEALGPVKIDRPAAQQ
jgi:hypothetical protein